MNSFLTVFGRRFFPASSCMLARFTRSVATLQVCQNGSLPLRRTLLDPHAGANAPPPQCSELSTLTRAGRLAMKTRSR